MNGRFRIRSASLRQTARKRLQGEHIENDTFHLSADRAHRLNDRGGRTARRHSGSVCHRGEGRIPGILRFFGQARRDAAHQQVHRRQARHAFVHHLPRRLAAQRRTHAAGKSIEPVAVSVSPARYTDPAKVEKWFRRNCTEVLGRECTPLEKGDWLTYVISQ
jgi:hypothetical protein